MSATESTSYGTERFLSFELDGKEFAIALSVVREVISFPELTRIPSAEPYFLGLMNLRDEVVPIVDLRTKLSMQPTLDHDTAVIVCNLAEKVIGIVVDSINSVFAPPTEQIFPVDSTGRKGGDYVAKAIRRERGLVLVLNLDQIISASDQVLLETSRMQKAE